eukprot:scaffold221332_cov21-Prasinocladus_malaysianus.AAC.1
MLLARTKAGRKQEAIGSWRICWSLGLNCTWFMGGLPAVPAKHWPTSLKQNALGVGRWHSE